MPLKDISRKEATLITRVRTSSAFARSWQRECAGQIDPTFLACEVDDTIEHALLGCPKYRNERTALLEGLNHVHPVVALQRILYRTGIPYAKQKCATCYYSSCTILT